MKTIGLIGGLSWASSREYYSILNTEYNQRKGKNHSCPIVMYSFDFQEMEILQEEGNWIKLTEKMTEAAMKVEKGGADLILVCSNTMHYCTDAMQASVMIPVLHIADAAGETIASSGIKKIGLLGTQYLMNMSFYPERLKKNFSVETLLPDESEIETVNNIIYSELVKGIVRERSRETLTRITANLIKKGAGGILLGCTELPLILGEQKQEVPFFNSTRIHALAGLDFAMKEHLYA